MKNATSPSNLRFLRRGHLAGFIAYALAAALGAGIASAQAGSPAGHPATAAAIARPQTAANSAPRNKAEESEAKPDDASHQGIKVRGHWKIDIKNPDGTLASTHEFENSLLDGGGLFSLLLTSYATSGEPSIWLTTNSGSTLNIIAESSTGYWATGLCTQGYPCAYNLTASVQCPAGNCGTNSTYQVVLSGSFVSASAENLLGVQTHFATCSNATGYATATPAQCLAGSVPTGTNLNNLPLGATINSGVLTGTSLANAISVLSGQTIQVTVTLSFS